MLDAHPCGAAEAVRLGQVPGKAAVGPLGAMFVKRGFSTSPLDRVQTSPFWAD